MFGLEPLSALNAPGNDPCRKDQARERCVRKSAGLITVALPRLAERFALLCQSFERFDHPSARFHNSFRDLAVGVSASIADKRTGPLQLEDVITRENRLRGFCRSHVCGQFEIDVGLLSECMPGDTAEDDPKHINAKREQKEAQCCVRVRYVPNHPYEGDEREAIRDCTGPNPPTCSGFARSSSRSKKVTANFCLETHGSPSDQLGGGWGAVTPQAEGVRGPSRPGVHAPSAPPPVRPAGPF